MLLLREPCEVPRILLFASQHMESEVSATLLLKAPGLGPALFAQATTYAAAELLPILLWGGEAAGVRASGSTAPHPQSASIILLSCPNSL